MKFIVHLLLCQATADLTMFGPANLFNFQMLWGLTCSLDSSALGVACATCKSSVYLPYLFLVEYSWTQTIFWEEECNYNFRVSFPRLLFYFSCADAERNSRFFSSLPQPIQTNS